MFKFFKISGNFFQNISIVMSGTVIANVIPLVISPILTRLYSPSDFGLLSIFVAIASILSVISAMRYDLAIVQPNNDKDAASIVVLSISIVVLISMISAIFLYLLKDKIQSYYNIDDMGSWLYLIPLSVFITGSYQTLNFWHIRKQNFKNIALCKINRSIGISSAQIGLNYISNSSISLMLGYVFGEFSALLTHLKKSLKKDKKIFQKIKFNQIKKNFLFYKNMPKYSSIAAIANNLSLYLPLFFVGKFFDFAIVGFISLSFRVLSMPVLFASNSLSEVFYQKISEKTISFEEAKKLTIKLTFFLFLLILPFVIIIFFNGPNIFAFVFGEAWQSSGEFASILVFGYAARFIASPLSVVLNLNINIKLNTLGQFFQLTSLILMLIYHISSPINALIYALAIQQILAYSFQYILIMIGVYRIKNYYF